MLWPVTCKILTLEPLQLETNSLEPSRMCKYEKFETKKLRPCSLV